MSVHSLDVKGDETPQSQQVEDSVSVSQLEQDERVNAFTEKGAKGDCTKDRSSPCRNTWLHVLC